MLSMLVMLDCGKLFTNGRLDDNISPAVLTL